MQVHIDCMTILGLPESPDLGIEKKTTKFYRATSTFILQLSSASDQPASKSVPDTSPLALNEKTVNKLFSFHQKCLIAGYGGSVSSSRIGHSHLEQHWD